VCAECVQRRLYESERWTVRDVWSGNLQKLDRQCGLHTMRSRKILGFDGRDELDDLPDVS